MLTCKDMTTEAHHLIDGELGFFKTLSVKFHLLICKYCRRYVRQLRTSLGALKSERLMQVDEPSEAEIDQLIQQLMKVKPEKPDAD